MAYFRRFVVLFLLCLPCFAFAGYADLSPPFGWLAGGANSGAGGTFNAAKVLGSNTISFASDGTVLVKSSINAAGRTVTMPAVLRYSSTAARVAANFIAFNPYVRVGLAVATWLSVGKIVWDEVEKRWVKQIDTYQDASEFAYKGWGENYFSTPQEACAATITSFNGSASYVGVHAAPGYDGYMCDGQGAYYNLFYLPRVQICPTGSVFVNGQCMVKGTTLTPLNPQEAADEIAKTPMPVKVPEEIPAPLPVELPKINPVPSPDGDPAPLRIPTGDPVKLPNPDPANQPDQWRKPVIDILPSPSPESPWRVDLQPKDIISTDPNKLPDSAPVPPVNPNNPPDPNKPQDKSQDKQPDFCESHPDSIACKKLDFDTPDPEDIKQKQVDISLIPDSGWDGPAQCPSPKQLQVSGYSFQMPYDLLCDFMSYIKPIIISVAWLSALGIVFGGFRGAITS